MWRVLRNLILFTLYFERIVFLYALLVQNIYLTYYTYVCGKKELTCVLFKFFVVVYLVFNMSSSYVFLCVCLILLTKLFLYIYVFLFIILW